jgi:SAM-dependent methyltransferase
MARKPAADKQDSGAEEKSKRRRKPSAAGPWRPPPLPWILRAGRDTNDIASPVRILCSGIAEAFLLAANLPDAEVVAFDDDPQIVKTARAAAGRRRLRQLRIEEASIDQPALGELVGGNFDLVLAHDVLHRAKDADAAFRNLAAACAQDGTVYASVRSSSHPSARFDDALKSLGLRRDEIGDEDAEGQAVVRMLAGLGGFPSANGQALPEEFKGGGTGPAPLAAWLDRAAAAGLHLRATSLTAKTLPATLNSGGTKSLAAFSNPKLGIFLDAFLQPGSVELVFARTPPVEVPWSDPELLRDWRPVSRFLPLAKLPEMTEPWNGLASVEVEIHGVLDPQSFTLSHYLLELIRRSDGTKTLGDLMAEIPHETDIAGLVPALHFLHHAFILELQQP